MKQKILDATPINISRLIEQNLRLDVSYYIQQKIFNRMVFAWLKVKDDLSAK